MNPDLDAAIDSYLVYCRDIRNFSDHTVSAYAHDLKLLGAFIGSQGLVFGSLRFEDARRFVTGLKRDSYSESSMNRIISGVKTFYAYCLRFEIVSENPFSLVKSMKRQRTLPAVLTVEEVRRFIHAPGHDVFGMRDRVIFRVLYSTGCRLSELLAMEVKDLDLPRGRVIVHGKGSKDRFVFLSDSAVSDIGTYLRLRSTYLEGLGADPVRTSSLFINKQGKQLTPQGVHYIFQTYAKKTGIEKHVTPHTFRHTFATQLLDHDAGIRVVQELLGHENISTTQIYSHVSVKRLKDVYTDAHPHGRRTNDEF